MAGSTGGTNPIRVYRDDGPLARQLGVLAGGQIPPLLTAFAGGVVTLILVLTGVSDLPGITISTPVVATLLAGLGAGHPHSGRLDWLVPPILRVTEYTFVAMVGLSSSASRPVVYVLLAAMAFHHYDLVYRVRQRIEPPSWVNLAGLGWDGRMLVVAVGAMFGIEPFAFGALAGYLWVLFAGESIRSWLSTPRQSNQTVDLEEEGA
jgi:hypothetical protein